VRVITEKRPARTHRVQLPEHCPSAVLRSSERRARRLRDAQVHSYARRS
jgi:hypothetical protein